MRETVEKVKLFERFFTGRTDVYGTYDPKTGRAYQVKQPVTDQVLLSHLKGKRPYGVYLLEADRVRAAAVDFDDNDPAAPLAFVASATGYSIPAHIERSKSKGFHVWLLFAEEGVTAAKARLVIQHILAEIGKPNVEVFPKQDALVDGVTYGNFINAPLFGALVPQGRTVFVDPSRDMQPYPNQWDFLESIERISGARLEEIISANGLGGSPASPEGNPATSNPTSRQHLFPRSSLPICAQKMLNDGVTDNQRVACFRLAIHFNRLGVPFDITVAALEVWARKNHPAKSKRTITEQEVREQADSAYKKAYRSFGCRDAAVMPFCEPECPLFQKVNDGRMQSVPTEHDKQQMASGTAGRTVR